MLDTIPVVTGFGTELITFPDACICVAVISSMVSISLTVAALVNISSASLFISKRLPNVCVVCRGTIKKLTNLGDSLFIIYALSSWK